MVGIAVVMVCIGVGIGVLARQRFSARLGNVGSGLLVTYITVLLMMGIGELYFRYGYAEPDGLPTLASQNWMAQFWQTNSLGYRDREWTAANLQDRTVIAVLGDSFAAGWGIENPADRFGDVLAAKLGDGFAVVNMGEPGASTAEELENFQAYPFGTPDVVILQYYLNDIETAALSIGLDPHLNPMANVPEWVNESYLANFIYWRLVGRLQPEQRGTLTYWQWLYSMYDHSAVWAIHAEQLNELIDAVESEGAALITVLFPNMLDPVGSIPYIDRVAQVFEARGYDATHVLKLFDAAEAMPIRDRIVSERDAHASAAFNQVVGGMLYERVMIVLGHNK
jgi:hypothetical protein